MTHFLLAIWKARDRSLAENESSRRGAEDAQVEDVEAVIRKHLWMHDKLCVVFLVIWSLVLLARRTWGSY